MRFSKSTRCFYAPELAYQFLPDDLVEVDHEEFLAAITARQSGSTLDYQDGKLVILPPPKPTLDEIKAERIKALKIARAEYIQQPVVSNVLGQPHIYDIALKDRQVLSELITLGIDSKFTCIDIDGVKARRLHTAEQLKQLMIDIHMALAKKFDAYEVMMDAVLDAQSEDEL